MDRQKAWQCYFTTGDTTPLIKAYWKSIEGMAWAFNAPQQEDLFQVGMLGLLKAIRTLDVDRVKSLDAWVYLNVRSAMRNMRRFPQTDSVELLEGVLIEDDVSGLGQLDELPKREALILRLIDAGYKRTEIGLMFDLSSMRIGQLEKRALKKLQTCGEVVNAPL